jgi:hypothetical protein
LEHSLPFRDEVLDGAKTGIARASAAGDSLGARQSA